MSGIKGVVLLLFFGIFSSASAQQIELKNCESLLETNNTPQGIPFYAIKDAQNTGKTGIIVFSANSGEPGWVYSWTYNGMPQLADISDYSADSSSFSVDVQGNGVYEFNAQKGSRSRTAEFTVFHDYIPQFLVSLDSINNCEAILIKENEFRLSGYDDNGTPYYGNKDLYYQVARDGNYRTKIRWTLYPTNPELILTEYVDSKDAYYNLKITDRFGFEWEGKEVRYNSVIPKAGFQVVPQKGEAPLEVDFTNASQNAQKYEWFLYKDSIAFPLNPLAVEDSLLDNKIRTESDFTYIYQHSGLYDVKLIAYNTKGTNQCSDTAGLDNYILVDSSLVDVPNVFTPNGDGINDVFKVKAQSLKSFEGVIINRWGRNVFEWRNPEEGWDGRINGKLANPGTYFYIIKAQGLERNAKKYLKKGPLLLVR